MGKTEHLITNMNANNILRDINFSSVKEFKYLLDYCSSGWILPQRNREENR